MTARGVSKRDAVFAARDAHLSQPGLCSSPQGALYQNGMDAGNMMMPFMQQLAQQMHQMQQNMMHMSSQPQGLPGLRIFDHSGSQVSPLGNPMRRRGADLTIEDGQGFGVLKDTEKPESQASQASGEAPAFDERDAIAQVQARMLARKKRKVSVAETALEIEKGVARDEADDEDADEANNVSPLPKKKVKRLSGQKQASAKSVQACKNEWPKKPTISWEKSREQVMGRSGRSGAGSTKKFEFSEFSGSRGARKAAEKWLEKTMKEYNKFHGL